MSLTSMLKNDESVIKLFNTIPDLSELFKTIGYHNEAFPRYIKSLSPRIQESDAALVGTSYDFWLRAYIQHLNNNLEEDKLSDVVLSGLNLLSDDKVLNQSDITLLRSDIRELWSLRNDYILGKIVNEELLIKGCIRLAYCEAYYRSRNKTTSGNQINYFEINDADVQDMRQLIHLTKQNPWMFTTKKKMLFNPSFSHYSDLVGGADADFVIGQTIFDIKTTNFYKYNKDYVSQLIGYYLLSEFDNKFPIKINQLAIFYARYNKIVYISIEDIKKVYNLDNLYKYFYQVVAFNNQKDILNMKDDKFNRKFSILV